jgi:hypothetical protein
MYYATPRARGLGDLLCNYDMEKFNRDNRVPLLANSWNRWVLARTTKDNPSPLDVENTLRGVFSHWFRWTIESRPDQTGSPIDPTVFYGLPTPETCAGQAGELKGSGRVTTTRHGAVDLLHPVKITNDQPIYGDGSLLVMPNGQSAKRDHIAPLPTIAGPGVIWVVADFVWRGTTTNIPWPVARASTMGIRNDCAEDADWALWAALRPPSCVTPAELTGGEKFISTLQQQAWDYNIPILLGVAVLGLGIYAGLQIGHGTQRLRISVAKH